MSHQQTVEFGQVAQGKWEEPLKKGTERRALGTLTSMGMKCLQTSQAKRSAELGRSPGSKMTIYFSSMSSESEGGSQAEGFEEMRNKERNSK